MALWEEEDFKKMFVFSVLEFETAQLTNKNCKMFTFGFIRG